MLIANVIVIETRCPRFHRRGSGDERGSARHEQQRIPANSVRVQITRSGIHQRQLRSAWTNAGAVEVVWIHNLATTTRGEESWIYETYYESTVYYANSAMTRRRYFRHSTHSARVREINSWRRWVRWRQRQRSVSRALEQSQHAQRRWLSRSNPLVKLHAACMK